MYEALRISTGRAVPCSVRGAEIGNRAGRKRDGSVVLKRAGVILTGAAVIASCVDDPQGNPSGAVPEVVIRSVPDTLVSLESGVIGRIAKLGVGEDGSIWFTDSQANALQRVDASGAHRTIGREGQGPGEFIRPFSLVFQGDSVLVVDSGNGRVQFFGLDGAHRGSRPVPVGQMPTLGPDGAMVRPTMGIDSVLAVIHDPEGEEVARIGELAAPLQNPVILSEMKREIAAGGVPGMFLNAVTPVIDERGSIWLVTVASGRLQKYDPSGRLLLETTVDEPEFAAAREQFVTANAEAEPNRITGLRYILAAGAVGADLWLLLNAGEEGSATFLVLSSEGEPVRRIRFPGVVGAENFALSPGGESIHFVIPGRAELVRVRMEEVADGGA
jgi:hypothetical protein